MTFTAQDITTALFELGAFGFQLLSVRALLRDKRVLGVSIWPSVFFMVLGFWQVYAFAWGIGPLSSIAAVFVACTNLVWISLAIHYGRQNSKSLLDHCYGPQGEPGPQGPQGPQGGAARSIYAPHDAPCTCRYCAE